VFELATDLATPRITGTSPGSSIQYETPLNVVPTSNASTSFRVGPLYGSRGNIVIWRLSIHVSHFICIGHALHLKGHIPRLEAEIKACVPRVVIDCARIE
jgi:hypothetical protein